MEHICKKQLGVLVGVFVWIAVCGAVAGQEASDGISWFVHISDTHISDFAPKRGADLSSFVQRELPFFDINHVLITGDLVDGKKKSRRSQQRIGEWEQYQRMVQQAHDALGISNESFIDIRGNHDMFDASLRNSERDFYRRYGVQGESWSQGRVLIHPKLSSLTCPLYCLVGVDLTPNVGLRSPTNFFGQVTDEIIQEFENKVTEDMRQRFAKGCNPVYIAYGHYPLSIVGQQSYLFVRDRQRLKQVLLKYGIYVWLCGHLHDEFGNHLHRLHRGEASTLLELELADWKFVRRFRIVAVDSRQLSFMDLQWIAGDDSVSMLRPVEAEAQIEGAVVMITSPPSPYFAPLGNTQMKRTSDASAVRALVWPMDDVQQQSSMHVVVSASFFCKDNTEPYQTVPMNATKTKFLYEISADSEVEESSCDHISVQIQAQLEGTESVSLSEKRWIKSGARAEAYPHALLEALVLAYPWYSVFQNLFISMVLLHLIVLLVLPKILSHTKPFRLKENSLDDEPNGENGQMKHTCSHFMLAPGRALVTLTRFKVFWWGQLSFALLMLFGPWSFARVLSNRPLGIMFIPTVHVQHTTSNFDSVFSPEMPFRACFFYTFVVFPSTFWIVWTLNRCAAKGNGTSKRHKLTTVLYIIAGIFPLLCFVYSLYVSWLFYGPLSVFLSPVFAACVVVNGYTVFIGIRSIPKFRQE